MPAYRKHQPRPAWVIQLRAPDNPGFAGVFLIDPAPLPAHLDAYRTAAWRTRAAAIAALPRVRASFPRAQVMKVMLWCVEANPFGRPDGSRSPAVIP